jgi:uncharacterized protein YlxW (UPF0749 family)
VCVYKDLQALKKVHKEWSVGRRKATLYLEIWSKIVQVASHTRTTQSKMFLDLCNLWCVPLNSHTAVIFCLKCCILCSVLLFIYLLCVYVDYFRSISKALEDMHTKESRLIQELQNDREQENKLKNEIEVCFNFSLSLLNRMGAC